MSISFDRQLQTRLRKVAMISKQRLYLTVRTSKPLLRYSLRQLSMCLRLAKYQPNMTTSADVWPSAALNQRFRSILIDWRSFDSYLRPNCRKRFAHFADLQYLMEVMITWKTIITNAVNTANTPNSMTAIDYFFGTKALLRRNEVLNQFSGDGFSPHYHSPIARTDSRRSDQGQPHSSLALPAVSAHNRFCATIATT